MTTHNTSQPVLFFDGACKLCNRFVQFVIRHDREKLFLFASLQSEAGKQMLETLKVSGQKIPDSVILSFNDRYYLQSDATLQLLRLLGGSWKLLYGLTIIPRFIRNGAYDLIARNSYKWFGKRDACMVPTAELRARFLE